MVWRELYSGFFVGDFFYARNKVRDLHDDIGKGGWYLHSEDEWGRRYFGVKEQVEEDGQMMVT